MTVLAVGTDHEFDYTGNSGAFTEYDVRIATGNTNYYDVNYNRRAPMQSRYTAGCTVPYRQAHTGDWAWFHAYLRGTNSSYYGQSVQLRSASGTTVVGFSYYTQNAYTRHRVFDATGTLGDIYGNLGDSSLRQQYDVAYNIVTGECIVYTNTVETHRFQGTPDSDNVPVEIYVSGESHSGSHNAYFSELIAADSNTRGMRVQTVYPNADGTTAEWSGTYTDVNEASLNGDTYVWTETSGETQTFVNTTAGEPDNSGRVIETVLLTSIGTALGGAPDQLKHVMKIDGTNVEVGDALDISSSALVVPLNTFVDLNPNTGQPFTVDEINAIETGFKVDE